MKQKSLYLLSRFCASPVKPSLLPRIFPCHHKLHGSCFISKSPRISQDFAFQKWELYAAILLTLGWSYFCHKGRTSVVKLKKTSSCVQCYASPPPLYVYMACQQLLTFSITFLRVGKTLENLQHSAVKLFKIIWKGLLLKDCRQKRPFNSYFLGKKL